MIFYFHNEQLKVMIKDAFTFLIKQANLEQARLVSLNATQSKAMKILVRVDVSMNQKLDIQEFEKLLGELQIDLSERKTLRLFSKYKKNEQVSFKDIYRIIEEYNNKQEVFPIFDKYSNPHGLFEQNDINSSQMTAQGLRLFYEKEQN